MSLDLSMLVWLDVVGGWGLEALETISMYVLVTCATLSHFKFLNDWADLLTMVFQESWSLMLQHVFHVCLDIMTCLCYRV